MAQQIVRGVCGLAPSFRFFCLTAHFVISCLLTSVSVSRFVYATLSLCLTSVSPLSLFAHLCLCLSLNLTVPFEGARP